MSPAISGSLIRGASTAQDLPSMTGISALKKALNVQAGQNAQLLASVPQAPQPTGQRFDTFA